MSIVATVHGKGKIYKVKRAYPGFSALIVLSLKLVRMPDIEISSLYSILAFTGQAYGLLLQFFQELKQLK